MITDIKLPPLVAWQASAHGYDLRAHGVLLCRVYQHLPPVHSQNQWCLKNCTAVISRTSFATLRDAMDAAEGVYRLWWATLSEGGGE